MTEYKRYDSDSKYINFGARLTKNAEIVKEGTGDKAPMVRLTFVDSSRNEADCEMWIDCVVQDRQAQLATFLQKGDTLGVEGHLTMRKYGEPEKVGIGIRRGELHIPIDLFVKLKERGFTPGEGGGGKKPAAPPAKKPRPTVNLDD